MEDKRSLSERGNHIIVTRIETALNAFNILCNIIDNDYRNRLYDVRVNTDIISNTDAH